MMSDWVTCHYRFRESQDSAWEKVLDHIPEELCGEIDFDFGRCWIVDLPPMEAILVFLSLADRGVESCGDGRFWLPDNRRVEVTNLLHNQTRVRGRWWSIRRAHFGSKRARTAFQSALADGTEALAGAVYVGMRQTEILDRQNGIAERQLRLK